MNDRFVEDLKSRIDIVEVVKKYAELKRSGKNYKCLSPFRNEKTPSFSVSPDKQFWYDFGSSEGGDVVSFLEKAENISFMEAIEMLADMAGVQVPVSAKNIKGASKEEKNSVAEVHEAACGFFEKELQKSKKAKEYLEKRGITLQMISDWRLGYGGDGKDGLSKYLLSQNFSEKRISESGVSFERDFGDQRMMDRFWGRIMIPIQEPKQKEIIAFSGRDILEREKVGKYVNSPENPLYNKSATLFGLDKARPEIRDKDEVIFVEGNLDVLFAHDLGYKTTVATCGTSLTDAHLRLIKRITKNIIFAFDSDVAGKKATLRGVDMCLKEGLEPWIISLEDGKDIAEMAVKNPETVHAAVKNKERALDFLFDRFAAKCLDGTVQGEKKYLDSFFSFLRLCLRPIEVDDFLTKISQKLNRPKSVIESEFHRFVSTYGRGESLNSAKEKTLDTVFKPNNDQLIEAYPYVFGGMLGNKEIPPTELMPTILFIENLHSEEPDKTVVQKEYDSLLQRFKKKGEDSGRMEAAKKLREQFGNS